MKTPDTSRPGAWASALRVTSPMRSRARCGSSTMTMTLPEERETHCDSSAPGPAGRPRDVRQAPAAPVEASASSVHRSRCVSREEAPILSRRRGEEKM